MTKYSKKCYNEVNDNFSIKIILYKKIIQWYTI
ncbi:hypothetical protein [Staphylococcus phage vB_ScaM-V1SC04]|nr:hypothetical protein [Staphylococcus phage vB_ScaM-V1SC04]